MTHVRRDQLTERQWDYVEQLLLGKCDKEIAEALGVSYKNVKFQLCAVNRLWGTESRLQIALKAMRMRYDRR